MSHRGKPARRHVHASFVFVCIDGAAHGIARNSLVDALCVHASCVVVFKDREVGGVGDIAGCRLFACIHWQLHV